MHHPTDRIAHTTAFVTPVVEHWLEREIAEWVNNNNNNNKKNTTIMMMMIMVVKHQQPSILNILLVGKRSTSFQPH